MVIGPFKGQWAFLSNFHPAKVQYEGVDYPSVEHAYVAGKTENPVLRSPLRSMTASEAKGYGRKLRIRKGWDTYKLGLMESLLEQKFAHPHLREALQKTAPHELIELNWWGDTFWGQSNGKGENHLGKLLMKIRG